MENEQDIETNGLILSVPLHAASELTSSGIFNLTTGQLDSALVCRSDTAVGSRVSLLCRDR